MAVNDETRRDDLADEHDGPRTTSDSTIRSGALLPITIDGTHFDHKPYGDEIAGITRRMQAAGVSWLTIDEMVDHILAGGTWCTGFYTPCSTGWGDFVGARIFALDFDDGNLLMPAEAERRAYENDLSVLMYYPTFSSTPEALRYRLVLDGGDVIHDEDVALDVLAWLLLLYPEADQKCRNLNRLWFGTNGGIGTTF